MHTPDTTLPTGRVLPAARRERSFAKARWELGKPLQRSLAVSVALLSASALVRATGFDQQLALTIYRQGSDWPLQYLPGAHVLNECGEWPALVLAATSLVWLLASLLRGGARPHLRPLVFLVLLFLIGPGLVINTLLKDQWGRPRPRQTVQCGGQQEFMPVLGMPRQEGGGSFPCGHAGAATYLAAPYFVLRRKRRRLARTVLLSAGVYALAVGIARLLAGGHYFSDVLWAIGLIWLCAEALAAWILKPDPPSHSLAGMRTGTEAA